MVAWDEVKIAKELSGTLFILYAKQHAPFYKNMQHKRSVLSKKNILGLCGFTR